MSLGLFASVSSDFALASTSLLDEHSCSEIRLDRKGGPLDGVPTRDQGILGSCTAHAAAVLIDVHLGRKYPPPDFRGPPAHCTSPFALYVEEQLAASFKGALTGKTGANIPAMIEMFKKGRGSCDLGDVSYDKDAFSRLATALIQYDSLIPKPLYEDRTHAERDALAGTILCQMGEVLKVPSDLLTIAETSALLEARNQVALWNKYVDTRCKEPGANVPAAAVGLNTFRVYSRWHVGDHPDITVDELRDSLNSALQNERPVGIGYCANMLLKNGPLTVDPTDAEIQKQKLCGMHASVVTGRKWRMGGNGEMQCMYEVQNSWGSGPDSCGVYGENRRKNKTDRTRPTATRGKVWISQGEPGSVADLNFFEDEDAGESVDLIACFDLI